MDYLLGVLYAVKQYESLETSTLQHHAHTTADSLSNAGPHSSLYYTHRGSTYHIPPLPNGAGEAAASQRQDPDDDGDDATETSPNIFHPSARPAYANNISMNSLMQLPAPRQPSRHLSVSTALAACSTATGHSLSREVAFSTPFLPGLAIPSPAPTAAGAGGSGSHPHRVEFCVPTRTISGKYLLVYLPPPWYSATAVTTTTSVAPTQSRLPHSASGTGVGLRSSLPPGVPQTVSSPLPQHASGGAKESAKARLGSSLTMQAPLQSPQVLPTNSSCSTLSSLHTRAAEAAGSPNHLTAFRAAIGTCTHQKLLIFYCLLLRQLANPSEVRRAGGMTALPTMDQLLQQSEVEPIQIAVLELLYTPEKRVTPATGSGEVGLGGASITSAGITSPLPLPTLSSAYPAQLQRCGSVCYVPSASTSVSAMASPRVTSPAPPSTSGDASLRTDSRFDGDGSGVPPHQLSTVLRHLLQGRPDPCLSQDCVVFDTETTQNPFYGGWYTAESTDGYRRVVEMCGIESWPAVVLFDPSGNVVSTAALDHIEEELAKYSAEVDANLVRAAAEANSPLRSGSEPLSTSQHGIASPQPSEPRIASSGPDAVDEQPAESSQPRTPSLVTADETSFFHPVSSGVKEALDTAVLSVFHPLRDPSTPTAHRDPSLSVNDPKVPTAEPTPQKDAAPATARYREKDTESSRLSLKLLPANEEEEELQDQETEQENGQEEDDDDAETEVDGREATASLQPSEYTTQNTSLPPLEPGLMGNSNVMGTVGERSTCSPFNKTITKSYISVVSGRRTGADRLPRSTPTPDGGSPQNRSRVEVPHRHEVTGTSDNRGGPSRPLTPRANMFPLARVMHLQNPPFTSTFPWTDMALEPLPIRQAGRDFFLGINVSPEEVTPEHSGVAVARRDSETEVEPDRAASNASPPRRVTATPVPPSFASDMASDDAVMPTGGSAILFHFSTAAGKIAPLALTTFTDTASPKPPPNLCLLQPLRRLTLGSVPVAEVEERMRQLANMSSSADAMDGGGAAGGAPTSRPLPPGRYAGKVAAPSLSLAPSRDGSAVVDRTSPSLNSPSPPVSMENIGGPHSPHHGIPSREKVAPDTVRFVEQWLGDSFLKFSTFTHVVLFFGAGWHPGTEPCAQALRHLCISLNGKHHQQEDHSSRAVHALPHGSEFPSLNHTYGVTSGDTDAPQDIWMPQTFTGSDHRDIWGVRSFPQLTSQVGLQSPLCNTEGNEGGQTTLHRDSKEDQEEEEEREGEEGDHTTVSSSHPLRHVQVIYISADESLDALRDMTSRMPSQWLCLSPLLGVTEEEQMALQQAVDTLRRIFRVHTFPRLVTLQLATVMPPAESNSCHKASIACTEDPPSRHDEWAVTQLYGEAMLSSDPRGEKFPWTDVHDNTLCLSHEDLFTVPQLNPAVGCLMGNARQYPVAQHDGCPPPGTAAGEVHVMHSTSAEEEFCSSSLLHSQPEMMLCVPPALSEDHLPIEDISIRTDMPPSRSFPPLNPFDAKDVELSRRLNHGGFFIVLGAIGSVEDDLYQQCRAVVDEARHWLYAEIEERKLQAWAEPTALQVVAPQSTVPLSYVMNEDRLSGPPTMINGVPILEDYASPVRSWTPSPAAAASLPHGLVADEMDGFSVERGSASAKHGFASSTGAALPSSAQTVPLDGSIGFLGACDSQASMLRSIGGGGGASAGIGRHPWQWLLPSVYFYDSIFTPEDELSTAAIAAAKVPVSGTRGGGREKKGDGGGGNTCKLLEGLDRRSGADESERRLPLNLSDGARHSGPRLLRRVNTAHLRKRHQRDLACLQEHIIAPILEMDGKMLPPRVGELFLACVRLPQRTCAVLRRRLATEQPSTPGLNCTGGGSGALSSSIPKTSAASPSPGISSMSGGTGGLTTAPPTPSVSLHPSSSSGNHSMSSSIGHGNNNSGGSQKPTTTTTTPAARAASPLPGSPMTAAVTPHHPRSTSPPLTSTSLLPVPVRTPASAAAPIAVAALPSSASGGCGQESAPTTLSNTLRTDASGKEGSPDPDATPLVSLDAIKTFLHEQILRTMEA